MEAKRIFGNKRTLIFMLVLVVINTIAFFCYFHYQKDDYRMGQKEYTEYLQNFAKKSEQIQKNNDQMSIFKVFDDDNSYAVKNRKQTEEDYQRICNVKLVRLEHQDVAAFFTFSLVSLCTILFGIWIVFQFMYEKRTKILLVIHAGKRGRSALFWKRLALLASGVFLFSIILYTIMFLIVGENGFEVLGYPIQSLPLAGGVTIPICISEFLVLYCLVQSLGSLILSLFLWTLLEWISKMGIALFVYLAVYASEYLLYVHIDLQSNLCFLRYANMFVHFDSSILWNLYFNVRIGNNAIAGWKIYAGFTVFMALFMITILFIFSFKKYPVRVYGKMHLLMEKMFEWMRRRLAGLPILFMEIYKILWCQKGIILVLFFVWVMWETVDTSQMYFSGEQEYQNAFLQKNAGSVTKEKLDKMKADEEMSEYAIYLEKEYLKGYPNLSVVNSRGYQVLLETSHKKDNAIAGSVIILIILGGLLYEKKRNMLPFFKSGKRDIKWIYWRKQWAADIVTVGIWLIKIFFEWKCVAIHYELGSLGSAVQSLSFMGDITMPISIGMYLFLFASRELFAFCTIKYTVIRVLFYKFIREDER